METFLRFAKRAIFALTAALSLAAVPQSAHANLPPNPGVSDHSPSRTRGSWELPVQKARMDVTEARDAFAGAHDVTLIMTRRPGISEDPSGLILLVDDQVKRFDIVGTRNDRCGARAYAATEINEQGIITLDPVQLMLIDHQGQRCPHAETYRWEAFAMASRGSDYLLRTGGFPEAVENPGVVASR